jgi:hypothetical protein
LFLDVDGVVSPIFDHNQQIPANLYVSPSGTPI